MLDPDPIAARCAASRRNNSGGAAETTTRLRRPMFGRLESMRRDFERFLEGEARRVRVLVLLVARRLARARPRRAPARGHLWLLVRVRVRPSDGLSAGDEQPQVAVLFLRVVFSLLVVCALLVWICSKETLFARVCAGRTRAGRVRRATCATRWTRATVPCRPSRSLRGGGCGCSRVRRAVRSGPVCEAAMWERRARHC